MYLNIDNLNAKLNPFRRQRFNKSDISQCCRRGLTKRRNNRVSNISKRIHYIIFYSIYNWEKGQTLENTHKQTNALKLAIVHLQVEINSVFKM